MPGESETDKGANPIGARRFRQATCMWTVAGARDGGLPPRHHSSSAPEVERDDGPGAVVERPPGIPRGFSRRRRCFRHRIRQRKAHFLAGWLRFRSRFVAGWLRFRRRFVAGWLPVRYGFVAGWLRLRRRFGDRRRLLG